VIAICFAVRAHYEAVRASLARLDEIMSSLPAHTVSEHRPLDPRLPTAVMLVGSYAGLGIHALLTVQRLFPGYFRNFLFVSVGVVDAATMKDHEAVEEVRRRTEDSLHRYVELARRLGLAADWRMSVATEAIAEAERLCLQIAREYPRAVFFAGKLVFQREGWFQRVLHNETAYALQRRLQFDGLNMMVLPVRVLEQRAA
jgi:hypothetical protein